MRSKFFAVVFGLITIALATQQAQSIGPADTLRNEYGVIINVPPPGQEGVDYVKQQFIASLKPGFLTLPQGQTGANLILCQVEAALLSLLQAHNVNYVKQVFTGYQLGDTLRIIGLDTCKVPDLSQIYLFQQSTQSGVINAVNALYGHEATLYSEPNFIRMVQRTPNDTEWNLHQWNLEDLADLNGIGCQTAWDGSTGSSTIKIGILDTGIQYDHLDLGGPSYPNSKVAGGYDYVNNDNNPWDDYGHGTECAGIAGALTNNYRGVAGIAGGWNQGPSDKGAKLYAIKVCNQYADCYCDDIAPGIVGAADPSGFGCQILSNSYGGNSYSEVERSAINFAYSVGGSFVAAKGNFNNQTPFFPADYDFSWITAVASFGLDGIYCQEGNCGYGSNYGVGVDIAAPGAFITTTAIENSIDFEFGGTSAACPHVAGSIALIKSRKTGLRNEDTDWMLKFSAKDNYFDSDNDVWTWNQRYGHGDLRISTAMRRIGYPLIKPYDFLTHTATWGYEYGHTDLMAYGFYGPPLHGKYWVRRYDVRINVSYPDAFEFLPYVWGVGHGSTGWSGAMPNYQSGWCAVVPGSQSSTGCQLQTFVYDVYDYEDLHHIGWYPCQVNEVALQYRLWGRLSSGNPEGPEEGKSAIKSKPEEFIISSAYPNPFNSTIEIRFTIAEDSHVQIDIFDILGKEVTHLMDAWVTSGDHCVYWNGQDFKGKALPSGVYFYRVSANALSSTQKITLLR